MYRQGTETSMIVDDKESFSVSLNTIFRASDEEIFERCGDDALQYLRFQRYIICYLVILMIFSIGVILPLNLHGNLVIIPIICILRPTDNLMRPKSKSTLIVNIHFRVESFKSSGVVRTNNDSESQPE